MPWLAYDFHDENKIKLYLELKQHIHGIPTLIILNPNNGKILHSGGRGFVEKMGPDAFEKWQDFKVTK